ncbi:MAG TPA: hypothetical protein V6C86_05115 [Oculatellaceae cyanobacterium]
MKFQRRLLLFLIFPAGFAINFSSNAVAEPKPAITIDGRAKDVILCFPVNFSCGRIFKIVKKTNELGDFDKTSAMDAKGDIHLPAGTQVRLKLSYAAVEKTNTLLNIAPESVVSMDCRSLDNLTDETLKYLAHFSSVRVLTLDETDVTTKGLQHLVNMKDLERLSLARTLVDEKSLPIISSYTKLRSLCLANNNFQHASLSKLSSLKNLGEFDIQSAGLTDLSLRGLSGFENLRKINLCHNLNLTDECLLDLRKLPKLKRLEVTDTKITATGLLKLKGTQIEHIMLDIHHQSPQAMIMLRDAMPNCKFTGEPKSKTPTDIFEPLK